MKKLLVSFLALTLLSSTALPAFAQPDLSGNGRPDGRGDAGSYFTDSQVCLRSEVLDIKCD